MTQFGFFFDQSRCYSCHACAVACKDWNGLEAGPEKWMSVYEWESGCFPDIRLNCLAFPCAHCDNPACIKACPTNAISRESEFGAVLVDQELCIGCMECYERCPYGAPAFRRDSSGATKMSKCTMCVDRLVEGELPVCVASCPFRAFDFGPVEILEEKYGCGRQLEGMPEPFTAPNYIVKPAAPKKTIVPYEAADALELMKQREGFDDVFCSTDEVTGVDGRVLESATLRMKHSCDEEILRATRNYAG